MDKFLLYHTSLKWYIKFWKLKLLFNFQISPALSAASLWNTFFCLSSSRLCSTFSAGVLGLNNCFTCVPSAFVFLFSLQLFLFVFQIRYLEENMRTYLVLIFYLYQMAIFFTHKSSYLLILLIFLQLFYWCQFLYNCSFSSPILSSIVIISFYIFSKKKFLKRKGLSDARVVLITKNKYGFVVHNIFFIKIDSL